MSEGFQFTDEQWADIQCELDAGRRARFDDMPSDGGRAYLDRVIAEWGLLGPERRESTNAACSNIADAVKLLANAAHTEAGQFLFQEAGLEQGWFDRLGPLHQEAGKMIGQSEYAIMGGRVYRDMLVETLIWVWEGLGGEPRTSKKADNTPDGPLIRYLCKVSRAAGVSPELTPHMAAGAVRKRNRHLKSVLQASSADELVAKMRAADHER